MRQHKSTMVELVEELRLLPDSPAVREMIEEAAAGEYHDFKNRKYICGKLESSCRLRQLGYAELAQRIEAGEFDEQPDEEDDDRLRAELERHNASHLKDIFGL